MLLGEAVHALIALGHGKDDPALRELIYERRGLAETMIARPVTKGFKAMLREQGLLAGLAAEGGGATVE